jgi:hypothetical protein
VITIETLLKVLAASNVVGTRGASFVCVDDVHACFTRQFRELDILEGDRSGAENSIEVSAESRDSGGVLLVSEECWSRSVHFRH